MPTHRPRGAPGLIAVLALFVVALGGPAAAQDDEATPADRPAFRSIAEQELALGDDELVWQASELPALPDEEGPIPFYAGFLYAHDAPLVVYRGSDRFTRLAAEKAMPVEDGDMLAPVAPRDDDVTFLALELVAEDEAFDPAGDPFRPEQGDYVLELLRAEFAGDEGVEGEQGAQNGEDEDEPATLEVAEAPVLLVVVAGEVELALEGEEPEELEAGDVVTVDEEVELRWLGEKPGVVLAAMLRLPEEEDGAEGDGEDGGDAAGPATTRTGGNDQDGGAGGGAGDADPTPTPKPTEAPAGDTGGGSTEDPPPPSGGSGDPGGGSSGSGDGLYEEGPGDGECLYCAPAQDGLFEEDGGGTCYLADGGGDPDRDGLDNCGEATAGTNPNNADSDGDGLQDGSEVDPYRSNPLVQDTDGDGIRDGDEVYRYGSNPTSFDMDGDGLSDLEEVNLGTGPGNYDSDQDGLWDGDEVYTYGTNPSKADSDIDCHWDGDELFVYGTNPNDRDSDGDGVDDYQEIRLGYNPLDPGHRPDEDLLAASGCGILAVLTTS